MRVFGLLLATALAGCNQRKPTGRSTELESSARDQSAVLCRSRDLNILDVGPDLQDIYVGRESPSTGKQVGAELDIPLRFSRSVSSKAVAQNLTLTGTKPEGSSCRSGDWKAAPAGDLVVRLTGKLENGCEYLLKIDGVLTDTGDCLARPFQLRFLVDEDPNSTVASRELMPGNDSVVTRVGINTPLAAALERYSQQLGI